MDTSISTKKNTALWRHDYGQQSVYRVIKHDGTELEIFAHTVNFPRSSELRGAPSTHIEFYADRNGHWTLMYSARSYDIKEIIRLGEVPAEPTPTDETPKDTAEPSFAAVDTDDSADGPDPRDNGVVPADEISKDDILAKPIDSLLDSGVSEHTLETIQNGVVTSRETYAF